MTMRNLKRNSNHVNNLLLFPNLLHLYLAYSAARIGDDQIILTPKSGHFSSKQCEILLQIKSIYKCANWVTS